ncbi:hypothetical protein JXA88_17670 [Candidatus Fermentibacteria bacterium]|nr:hypothetical protein [Candidatus Fermentibacteria bacterium]
MLAAAGLALVAAELAVRAVSPQAVGRAPAMYAADSVLIHRLQPMFQGPLRSGEYATSVTINDRGFRGGPWRLDMSRRVLVLGDSFTFGYGVEESEAYPAVLERLSAHEGCPTAVYNAGVPGYGTLQERGIAPGLLAMVRPQIVVLGFTVGSDLSDNLEQGVRPEAGYEVRDGFLVQKGTPGGTSLPLKAWMQERSHLYVLLQRARIRLAMRGARGVRSTRPCEHFLAVAPCGDMAVAWDLTATALRDIGDLCHDSGAQLIVLLIPHPVQVDSALWRSELAAFEDPQALGRFVVQERIMALCDELGVSCMDPLPAFRGRASTLFFRLDRHLTADGHAVLANTFFPSILTLLRASPHESVDTAGLSDANCMQ